MFSCASAPEHRTSRLGVASGACASLSIAASRCLSGLFRALRAEGEMTRRRGRSLTDGRGLDDVAAMSGGLSRSSSEVVHATRKVSLRAQTTSARSSNGPAGPSRRGRSRAGRSPSTPPPISSPGPSRTSGGTARNSPTIPQKDGPSFPGCSENLRWLADHTSRGPQYSSVGPYPTLSEPVGFV